MKTWLKVAIVVVVLSLVGVGIWYLFFRTSSTATATATHTGTLTTSNTLTTAATNAPFLEILHPASESINLSNGQLLNSFSLMNTSLTGLLITNWQILLQTAPTPGSTTMVASYFTANKLGYNATYATKYLLSTCLLPQTNTGGSFSSFIDSTMPSNSTVSLGTDLLTVFVNNGLTNYMWLQAPTVANQSVTANTPVLLNWSSSTAVFPLANISTTDNQSFQVQNGGMWLIGCQTLGQAPTPNSTYNEVYATIGSSTIPFGVSRADASVLVGTTCLAPIPAGASFSFSWNQNVASFSQSFAGQPDTYVYATLIAPQVLDQVSYVSPIPQIIPSTEPTDLVWSGGTSQSSVIVQSSPTTWQVKNAGFWLIQPQVIMTTPPTSGTPYSLYISKNGTGNYGLKLFTTTARLSTLAIVYMNVNDTFTVTMATNQLPSNSTISDGTYLNAVLIQ